MRILFVTPYAPSRIRVRGYSFLMHLCHEHDVTIVTQCISEQERVDIEQLRNQGYEVLVTQESKRSAALRSLLALPGSVPLQVAYARSTRFAQQIHDVYMQGKFDVVHVEHLRGIASMERFTHIYPLVWDAVDCISLLGKHTLTAGHSVQVRAVASLEHRRTQQYEAAILDKLKHVLVTSERDRQAMIELLRLNWGNTASSDEELGKAITVLPNGVDLDYFRPLQLERRHHNLVFSGKMSYHANVATALYLYRTIMPLIWAQRPDSTLTIVGSKPPRVIQQLAADPRVEVTGYVDDLRPYVARAEVMLSPMVYSVGIQNKVLEAMALGTPVVVAKQAAEALSAVPGRDLLVAESASDFANAVLRLMDDAALRDQFSIYGREYVERYHNWNAITGKLVSIYEQALARRKHAELAL